MALTNPFGALGLEETLARAVLYLEQIAGTMGRTYPDTNGNMRVAVQNGTISALSAVGGYNANYDQYCQMLAGADMIRSRIVTS